MKPETLLKGITLAATVMFTGDASAFFFLIPLPNLAKPPALNSLIEALEKSDETKAVAYVSEDKTFGTKNWVWGHYAGHVLQPEADRLAMDKCQAALANAKAQQAGGKPLYDFGTKSCELHSFVNRTVSAKAVEQAALAEQQRQDAALAAAQAAAPQAAAAASATASAAATPAVPAGTEVSSTQASTTSVSVPQSTTAAPATSPKAESTTSRRLRELGDLLKDGLITELEYNEKRKAILSNI